MNRYRADGGLSALDLVVVISVVGILVAIALPQGSPSREGARAAVCERHYAALNDELARELDAVLAGGATACGTTGGPEAVVACALQRHRAEDNPRNRNQTAYALASEVASNASSCRVGLEPTSTNGVRVQQYAQQNSTTSRTFTITIDGEERR